MELALSLTESRAGLAALGVVASLLLMFGISLRFLTNDALPGQQHWATVNASQSYAQRTFPSDSVIGSARVAEDARLWIPASGRYRVVLGKNAQSGVFSYAPANFLAGYLLPRHRDDSPSTRWVICIACDASTLGAGFDVVSRGPNGVLLGRITG